MKIVLALVGCCAVIQATAETLVEHEYGMNHDQLDDGFPFVPRVQVPEDDPSFAQGYFLRDAAEGPDNARCLDGTPPLYYHRKGTGSGANKWFIHQQGGVSVSARCSAAIREVFCLPQTNTHELIVR